MIKIDRDNLPNSVPALKNIIWDLLDVVEELRVQNAELRAQNAELRVENAALKHQVRELQAHVMTLEGEVATLRFELAQHKRHRFGRRSEKTSRPKMKKFDDSEEDPPRRRPSGRQRLNPALPRHAQEHDLPAQEKICPECGGFLSKMGELISEQLETAPPVFYVIQHVRPKYACRGCEGHVKVAPLPGRAIDKGIPGPGLLAEILVNKYQDHLPLYRQAQRYKRFGLSLTDSTINNWVMQCGFLLSPLVDAMKADLLEGNHLFSDDTHVRVLAPGSEKGVLTGRFWVYLSKGDSGSLPCTIYDYRPDRKGEGPLEFLRVLANR